MAHYVKDVEADMYRRVERNHFSESTERPTSRFLDKTMVTPRMNLKPVSAAVRAARLFTGTYWAAMVNACELIRTQRWKETCDKLGVNFK